MISSHIYVQLFSAQQMEVQVHDGLAAVLAAVVDNAVAAGEAEFLCDSWYLREDMTYYLTVALVDLICTADMRLGDEQDVHGRLGVKIMYSDDLIVFVYFFGRDSTVDYLTKNTVSHINLRKLSCAILSINNISPNYFTIKELNSQ